MKALLEKVEEGGPEEADRPDDHQRGLAFARVLLPEEDVGEEDREVKQGDGEDGDAGRAAREAEVFGKGEGDRGIEGGLEDGEVRP